MFSRVPDLAVRSFKKVFRGLRQEVNDRRGTVGFFYGCMVDYVYPEIGEAIVKLLNRAGYGVELPEQGCCGAPTLYTGMETTTKKIVKDNLVHFEGVVGNYDHVVTPCPTCTHVLDSVFELRSVHSANAICVSSSGFNL